MREQLEQLLRDCDESIERITHMQLLPGTQERTNAIQQAARIVARKERPSEELQNRVISATNLVRENYQSIVNNGMGTEEFSDKMRFFRELSMIHLHIESSINYSLGKNFFIKLSYEALASGRVLPTSVEREISRTGSLMEEERIAALDPPRLYRCFVRSALGMSEPTAVDVKPYLLRKSRELNFRLDAEISTNPDHESESKTSIIITGETTPALIDQGLLFGLTYLPMYRILTQYSRAEHNAQSSKNTQTTYRANLPQQAVRAHLAQISKNRISLTIGTTKQVYSDIDITAERRTFDQLQHSHKQILRGTELCSRLLEQDFGGTTIYRDTEEHYPTITYLLPCISI